MTFLPTQNAMLNITTRMTYQSCYTNQHQQQQIIPLVSGVDVGQVGGGFVGSTGHDAEIYDQ